MKKYKYVSVLIVLILIGVFLLYLPDSEEESASSGKPTSEVEKAENTSGGTDTEPPPPKGESAEESEVESEETSNRLIVRARKLASEEPVSGMKVYLQTPRGVTIDGRNSLSSRTDSGGRALWRDLPSGEGYRFGVSMKNNLAFHDINPGVADSEVLQEYKNLNWDNRLTGSESYVTNLDVLSTPFSIPEQGVVKGDVVIDTKTKLKGRVEVFAEPVEGAHVELKYVEEQKTEEGEFAGARIHGVAGTVTGEDGTFQFVGLDEKGYHLDITYRDENGDVFLITEFVNIRKGEEKDLGVLTPRMGQSVDVNIPLVDSSGKKVRGDLIDEEIPVQVVLDNMPSYKSEEDSMDVGRNHIETPWLEYDAPASFRLYGVAPEGRVGGGNWIKTDSPEYIETDRSSGQIFLPKDDPVLELPVNVKVKTKINIQISNLSRLNDLENLSLFFTNGDTEQTILSAGEFSEQGTVHETTEYLPVRPEKNNKLILRSALNDKDGIYYEKKIKVDQVGEEQRVDFAPVRQDGASIQGAIPEKYLPDDPQFRKSILIGFEQGRKGARYGTFSADKNGNFEVYNLPPETTMTMFLRGHTEKFETGGRGHKKNIEFDK